MRRDVPSREEPRSLPQVEGEAWLLRTGWSVTTGFLIIRPFSVSLSQILFFKNLIASIFFPRPLPVKVNNCKS